MARDTAIGRAHGIAAHYVRVAPVEVLCDDRAMQRSLAVKNRADDLAPAAGEQVALDFLHLVRLGLRRAVDALVADSVKLADALLRSDTPAGPVWHRYTGDGYGGHDDGSAFDGAGRGRGWPLLTGERGHYELAAGRESLGHLHAMAAMAQRGLLPEQIWDAEPAGRLQPGRPTGGAMPLLWAHAEFVKLAAARAAGHPLERLDAVWARYRGLRADAPTWVWTAAAPFTRLPRGKAILIVLPCPARLHLGRDGWRDARDIECAPQSLGHSSLHVSAATLAPHRSLEFTWQDTRDGRWHDARYSLELD